MPNAVCQPGQVECQMVRGNHVGGGEHFSVERFCDTRPA
jgi:hypothetical protein